MTVLDRAALVRRLMGDEELAATIITGFLDDIPDQMVALSQAVERRDALAVRQLAHSLKGAAATVGALDLSEASARLEASGRVQNLSDAGALLTGVGDRIRELISAVSSTPGSAVEGCAGHGRGFLGGS